jgi:hypothetical protein
MALLKIDSTDMPAPSVFRIPQYDLDSADTQRNEEGYLQRDRIRQGISKIELEWHGITNDQLSTLLNAVQPAQVSVTFLFGSSYETKSMYVGDRNVELVKNHGGDVRWNVSFNLTEY